MLEKIEQADLEFMQFFYYAPALAETLFSDYDNLTLMEDDKLGEVRLGQLPLLSYDALLDYNPELSDKENFQLKKGSSDMYCLGGRNFGKTVIGQKLDILISMATGENEKAGFSSYDQIHVKGVLEDITTVLENHPFFNRLKQHINKSPNYRITLKTGYLLESINMNISGKKPGASFFQKHLTRLWIDECSMETEEVYNKRRDAVSELGCIYRFSGMTNFTKYTPCGKIFYDLTKKSQIVNLPQYVNPYWDTKGKEQAIKDFGGEQSIGYRIFIKGEVVEEGVSVFDMQRVRQCYNDERYIKTFEISKEHFPFFEELLIVERPTNASRVFISADIGETAPTEIVIIYEVNDTFKYTYNITLRNLTDKEQYKIFYWLGNKLTATHIALDCSDGTGRSIFRSLAEVFPKENMCWVAFNSKIPIDFEKDDKGNVIHEKGQLVYKEEYVTEWSVKYLKDLLYGEKIELPIDHKFDTQINSVVAMQSGQRVVYSCISAEDHLFQAFQVFAISAWMHEFTNIKSIVRKEYFKGGA